MRVLEKRGIPQEIDEKEEYEIDRYVFAEGT